MRSSPALFAHVLQHLLHELVTMKYRQFTGLMPHHGTNSITALECVRGNIFPEVWELRKLYGQQK